MVTLRPGLLRGRRALFGDDMSFFPGNRIDAGGHLTRSVILVATFLASVPAAAQSVVRGTDGRVSVVAEAIPLATLLDRFAQLVDLQASVQSGLSDRLVTVKLESLPIPAALEQILIAAEVDFVLVGGAGGPVRIAVRDSRVPKESPAVPADVARVGDPRQQQVDDAGSVGEESPTSLSDFAAAERLAQLLAPTQRKSSPGESVVLPFPGPDGNPQTVVYSPPPPGTARLPFPGPDGEPLTVVGPPAKPVGQPVPLKEAESTPVSRDRPRRPGG